jgi:hypothetical protein
MKVREMIDGLVIVHDSRVDEKRYLEQVEGPHHVHCSFNDLPKTIQRDLAREYKKTDRSVLKMDEICREWAIGQRLVDARAYIDFDSTEGGEFGFERPDGIIWPIDAVLGFPKIDVVFEDQYPHHFRCFVNGDRVEGNIYQLDIPGGMRTKPVKQRLEERLPHYLNRDIEVPAVVDLSMRALLKSLQPK